MFDPEQQEFFASQDVIAQQFQALSPEDQAFFEQQVGNLGNTNPQDSNAVLTFINTNRQRTSEVPNTPNASTLTATNGDVENPIDVRFPVLDASGFNFRQTFTDPVSDTRRTGDFNAGQFQGNLGQGQQNAFTLNDTELAGLRQFNLPAQALSQESTARDNAFNRTQITDANDFNRSQLPEANQFNRGQIDEANQFNQDQKLSALERGLPGARQSILDNLDRANTFAGGNLLSTAEDRAFELAARSLSADGNVAGGFGDDSVFGRRQSDLLSASQRLDLSFRGQSAAQQWLQVGAQLTVDQPLKQNPLLQEPLQQQPLQSTTSQDIRGVPSVNTASRAVEQQGALTGLNTIDPGAALNARVQQDQFNAQGDFEAQRFRLESEFINQSNFANALNQVTSLEQERIANDQPIGQEVAGIAAGLLSAYLGGGGVSFGTGGQQSTTPIGNTSTSGAAGSLGQGTSGNANTGGPATGGSGSSSGGSASGGGGNGTVAATPTTFRASGGGAGQTIVQGGFDIGTTLNNVAGTNQSSQDLYNTRLQAQNAGYDANSARNFLGQQYGSGNISVVDYYEGIANTESLFNF